MHNVLLITADQMRADALDGGYYRTPHLDAFAADATRFARHYGQASPCGPARACLLTGMYLHNHRSVANGTPLDARFTNIALEARALGYAPALFGYTDTSPDPRGRPARDPALRSYEGVLPGFDPVCILPEAAQPWLRHLRARGHDTSGGVGSIYTPLPPRHPGELWGPARHAAEDSETAFLADRFLDWHADQPPGWFAHVSFLRPHPPWVAPGPWHSRFGPAAAPAPRSSGSLEEIAALHPWLDWRLRSQTRDNWVFGRPMEPAALTRPEVAQIRAVYAALVAEVDFHIGRILERLRAAGQYESTLIVFTADHGEMLGDMHLLGKESVFPQAFHVPLILRDPGPAAEAGRGRAVQHFTEAVDVMPTVLAWLGADPPPQCDGASLLPFAHGQIPARWRAAAHYALDFRDLEGGKPEAALGLAHEECVFTAALDGRFLYVHFTALPPLLIDPEAAAPRNLALDPAHAELARDQAMRLLSWRMRHEDQVLANLLLCGRGVLRAGRRP